MQFAQTGPLQCSFGNPVVVQPRQSLPGQLGQRSLPVPHIFTIQVVPQRRCDDARRQITICRIIFVQVHVQAAVDFPHVESSAVHFFR